MECDLGGYDFILNVNQEKLLKLKDISKQI